MTTHPLPTAATILAVDDDSLLLEMLDRILAKDPYTILHAHDGEAALKIIREHSDIDLILLDVLLPGKIDGLQLCQLVRSDPTRTHLPIVMLTALGHTDQISQALELGADDYITKPFSPREILARVHAALRSQQMQRALIETQNRYRGLVETSHDVIFSMSAAGQLTYVSPACQMLTGYYAETLLADAVPFTRFIHPEDVPRFKEWLTQRAPDGSDLELQIITRDGLVRWASLSWSTIFDQNNLALSVQGTLRNITHRKQIEADTWQRSQELAALNLIATRVNQSLELESILDEALDALMEMLGIEFGAIDVIHENRFERRAMRGLPAEAEPDWFLPPGQAGRFDPATWQSRELELVRERSDRPPDQISAQAKAGGIQTQLIVPLRQRGTLNGLLLLGSRVYDKFDPTEVTLISTVAEQISAAIANSYLYEETRQRLEQVALLNEVGRMLTSTLDLDKVLRVIMEATVSMLQGEAGSVLLLDEETGELVFAAAVGRASENLPGVRLPAGVGIAGRALAEGRSLLVADTQQDEHFYTGVDQVTHLTTRTLMAAPLRTRNRIIGVMEVINKRSGEFSETDLSLLDMLAPTAAAAIDNARLYARETQLTDQVRRRNRELGALHAISAALSQSLELQGVLDVTLMMLQPLLEYEAGSIALLDDHILKNKASHQPTGEPQLDRFEPALTVAQQAVDLRTVTLIPNTAQIERGKAWQAKRIGAFAAVPLWGHDHVQGVLSLSWPAAREFGEATAPLLAAIGQQIGVAIERAELFEAAQRRSQEMSALNNIIRAVTSTLDLEEVLAAAMEGVRDVLAVEAGALLLIDEADGQLHFRKTLGRQGEIIAETQLAPGEGIAGWVVEHRQAAQVNDAQNDPRWASRFDRLTGVETRAVLCVPLLVKDRVIGALEVLNKLNGPFTDQDLLLLQTMAASVSVAIDNAGLYQALAESTRQIERSYAQLVQSEKLAATGRLAMSLAHEINNPLQAIQNCLHLALEFPLDNERRTEYLKMAREEVERLSLLVQSMLDFYRPSRDEQPLADVRAVLERVLALSEQKLRQNQIELNLDLGSDPLKVQIAPDQLGQVFLNLVVNAAEAMGEGGRLDIRARLANDAIETRFSDTGPGIPPEQLPHIFEPFYSTKVDGIGLGLAISYTIVERHGGAIRVDSQLGKGTTFSVKLPQALLPEVDEPAAERVNGSAD
jgi:PAS domain S-box-containing protein